MRYLQTLGGERSDGDRAARRRHAAATPRISCCRSAACLHAEAGRDANVLTHELQERVADAIGCRARRRGSASRR
jgi:hypothetical protein